MPAKVGLFFYYPHPALFLVSAELNQFELFFCEVILFKFVLTGNFFLYAFYSQ